MTLCEEITMNFSFDFYDDLPPVLMSTQNVL